MIEINNITKKYDSNTVLQIESLKILKGESFGLVGNNGAGKTTLFNLLLDLIKASTGQIDINGESVHLSENWKNITSSFIDESFLIGYLTPKEYFKFIADLRGVTETDLSEFLTQFESFFNGEILHKKKYLRDLSKGNQKKAGIAAALIGNPEVVVLDEPFANLDPSSQIKLKSIIKKLAADPHKTVLVSSHDLSHVTDVCNRIAVLEKGLLIKDIQTNEQTLKELEAHFTALISEEEE